MSNELSNNRKEDNSKPIAWVRKSNKNPSTYLTGNNNVPYLRYYRLDEIPFINHGFSTRLGGVSKAYLSSMNLSFTRGDEEENVITNYHRISAAIGFDEENLVAGDQTHTTNVRRVTAEDRGKGIWRSRDYTDVDGLITNEQNLVLVTYFADCVPLYLVDIKNKAIGLSHSGWKGTLHKMGAVTLKKMKQEFQTNPADVVVCIGPSICQDCYEVSSEVALAFCENMDEKEQKQILQPKPEGKYQLNLWEANRLIFLHAGVLEQNIVMPDLCTCCNPELLYSHRASKGQRGNLAAFLTIKS